MCGIVGYIGMNQVTPLLLEGLSRLEYRGYDSAGVAVFDGEEIKVVKAKGRLNVLKELTNDGQNLCGNLGIGHTRWATHGAPSVNNSHPHLNESKTIAVVHNGIIENFQELKDKMVQRGYTFISDTDTEVVAHMLDYYYKGDPKEAIAKVMYRIEGSYALGIIFHDFSDSLFAVRKDSPLIIGATQNGNFIASDVPAILKYTKNVYYPDNMEIVELSENSVQFYNNDLEKISHELVTVDWDMEAAEKGGFQHFMLKEIYEQPNAVRDTVNACIHSDCLDMSSLGLDDEIKKLKKLYIVACGSAYHAGVVGKYMFEQVCRIPVEVEVASEFRYRSPIFGDHSMVVVISQSGETADTLASLRMAKENGCKVLAFVNVVGSSIAREADSVFYTLAGPEISVATTKAYSAQLAALYSFSIYCAKLKNKLSPDEEKNYIDELKALPDKIRSILGDKERIQWFANKYANCKDAFFIGRGMDYAIALEGSLKLKEISYVHSEAYAAGELKHGTISLIEKNTLVAALITQPQLYDKTKSNIVEVQSRGAYVFCITMQGNYQMEDVADFTVYIPKVDSLFSASLTVIPLQLFAYYMSIAKGCDVDKPRNLAKSVTVE